MNPKVSILIPVYKSEEYISKCIQTVFDQTYNNLEIVIVNDATPDNSMKIVEKLSKNQSERIAIKIIHHEHNKGIASTRNDLLSNATGDYIFFVDSDDYITTNAVESLVNIACRKKADIVRCSYFECKDGQEKIIHHQPFSSKDDLLRQHVSAWNSIEALWQLFIRRSIIEEHHLTFAKGINGPEDYLMSFKLFYYSNIIIENPIPVYYYRKDNSQSLTSTNKTAFLDSMCKAMDATIQFLKDNSLFENYKEEALTRMFLCKQSYLLNKDLRNISVYAKTHPECNSYYRKFNYNKKQVLLFKFAEKKQYFLLRVLAYFQK